MLWNRQALILSALSAASVLLSSLLCWWSLDGIPHLQDEVAYTLQSRIFAGGERWAPESDALGAFFWLSEPVSVAGFPPGWPLLLGLGEFIGLAWLVNPLLSGLLAPLTFRLGRALDLSERTATLSAAFIALSPGVLLLAASRMSHTSVLVALLVVAWVVALRPSRSLAWWGAGLALGYVVLARPYDALLVGLPLIAIAAVRGRWSLGLLPALAGIALLFDNAYITGDATTWPVNLWFEQLGLGGCNRIGFGEGAGCMGQHTSGAALAELWSSLQDWDRLLLGLPGGGLVVVLGAWCWRRRSWLLLPLAVVAVGYALYWSKGEAYGARYWHPGFVTVPFFMAAGLERLLGHTKAWVAVVALSAWGLGQLGGLEDYWCVDRQVESELEGFKGVVVALGHGERLVPGHSVLLNREEDFVCSVDLETNDLTRLAQPLGDADLHVRTRAALRPELDAWLAETHPDAETLLAVQDVADDHRVLVDYGSLDQPAVLPDERLAQAWALVLLGDPEGARARLKGLARPDRLVPLARLHFVLGEFSVAEEVILLRLREEDPGDPEALLLLANIQAMTGRTEEGDQTFAQAEAARAARR